MKIERFEAPTKEIFEQFILNSKPFIITGVVDKWPCYTLWNSSSYLIGKIGVKEIPIREIGYNVGEWLGKTTHLEFSSFFNDWQRACSDTSKQKKDHVTTTTTTTTTATTLTDQQINRDTPPKYYLASLPIHKYFKEIMNDYVVPEIPREQGKSANLWVGHKGQVTPLHHDWSAGDPGMDGLHAVIYGRKLFRLFDPAANCGYIKRKLEWGSFHHAQVDLDRVDYDAHPEFAEAHSIDILVEQGEMLFIPKLWWHYVKTLEQSISINFWFQHLGSEMLKCTRHWCVIEDYLESLLNIQITEEKMSSLMVYFGDGYSQKVKPTKEEIRSFIENPLLLIQLPKFINSFANAAYNPLFKGEQADYFTKEITSKVQNWIKFKLQTNK